MMSTESKISSPKRGVLVWDLPTRLFHWLLASCLVASWITAEAGFDWTEIHFLLGYCSLGLILFRIIWGFSGTTHARFINFIRGPRAVVANIPKLFSRQPSTSVGHNPIGGWSTIAFIILVGTQATTGLFLTDDIFYAGPYNGVISGDLAGFLAKVHHLNFNVLQGLVVIHLLAIVWYRFGKGSRLASAMFSGRKQLTQTFQDQAITSSGLMRAALIASLVILAVVALVQLAPPPVYYDF